MLLEALIGILIFAIGILAMVAMQTTALKTSQDARFRTDAVNHAADILNQIMVNVNRSSTANLQTTLATFQHLSGGASCAFSGSASSNALVTNWVEQVTGTASTQQRPPLPGATTAMQQILVDTTAGAYNRVTITVCWKAPDDPVARKHILISYIT